MTLARAAICVSFGFLVSCGNQPVRTQSLGEAYAGPSSLPLRQDLSTKAPIVGTVKHGDKLDIVEYRHRLVKVRTPQGVEGWTDLRQLLTTEQMEGLRRMAESAAQFPSQGAATVFEPLNVHTEPNRVSPSFWQAPENSKVDVIGHKLTPRVQPAAATPAPVTKAAPTKRKAKTKQQIRIGPPPPPPSPKPPDNWQALSVPNAKTLQPKPPEAPPTPKVELPPPPHVPTDDWSLVRSSDGKAGWVLTRMLTMAIPDEVAQYAEGHRITSYFPLSQSKDGDEVKSDWLWTTINKGLEPYEFDSFRVFVWSKRHHRYETAYIERNVVGHFPVSVTNANGVPSFTLILEDDNGKLEKKTYTFEGYRIRMVHKEPFAASPEPPAPRQIAAMPGAGHAPETSLYSRLKARVRSLFR